MCAVFHRGEKNKAEKQEINLLQLAAFVGMFESMQGLHSVCFSAETQHDSESLSTHSTYDLKLTK